AKRGIGILTNDDRLSVPSLCAQVGQAPDVLARDLHSRQGRQLLVRLEHIHPERCEYRAPCPRSRICERRLDRRRFNDDLQARLLSLKRANKTSGVRLYLRVYSGPDAAAAA